MSAVVEKIHRAVDTFVGRTFELSITKGYVSRWGMEHAVRELIQNALDSESPFVYEFIDHGEGVHELRLASEFSTLTPATLLLGATSKAESEDTIGSFGEGYKIALLVLTRLGYDVEIRNGDLVWKPRFRFSRTFGDDLLVIDESFSPERGRKGLTFIVHGLGDDDVDRVRESCLRMQNNVGAIKETEFGTILLDQPGRLYVGSLFVCKTQLKYGYSIKSKYLRLDRDRQTVSDWAMTQITTKAWYETGETNRIAKMIQEEVPDVEYSRYDAPEIVKEECYRIFRQNNPGAIIASSPEDMKAKIEAGMTKVVYSGGWMYSAVAGSRSYQAERPFIEKAQATPKQKLAEFLRDYRSEMRTKAIVAFKKLIEDAEKWTIK